MMPLLLNVPGFDGIRIHKGNSAIDTSGCILVEILMSNDRLLSSTTAYQRLYDLLYKTLKKIGFILELKIF